MKKNGHRHGGGDQGFVVLSPGRDLAFEVMPEGDEGMNRLDLRRGSSYAKALG